ncbi:MAG TPA: hypothetical protein VF235_04815 [Actinomycetota bacterium]
MTERDTQYGDDEIGECHICHRRFATQAELFAHLEHDHDGDTLADDAGVR